MTPSILRVYDPSECSASGTPLDWDRCRRCGGSGFRTVNYGHTTNADGRSRSGGKAPNGKLHAPPGTCPICARQPLGDEPAVCQHGVATRS
jgi:hypothetical protein